MEMKDIITDNQYQGNPLPSYLITDENSDITDSCLYVIFSRIKVSELPVTLAAPMMIDAIKLKRFYCEHKKCNNTIEDETIYSGEIIMEGINPCLGPKDFDEELLDNSPLGLISYETTLIMPYLMQMNDSLQSHNISTVQSQPAYYNNSGISFDSFFSVPFVDFLGSIDALNVYQQMKLDPRLTKCLFDTFYQENEETGEICLRLCIMRPYIDINGKPNSGFSDTDFWETLCAVCKDFE
jgi:hypothetical protein